MTNPTVIKPNYKKTVPGLGMINKNGQTGNLIIEFTIEFPDGYSSEIIESLKPLL
jgi:DnaJ-class molecular chaperone